MMGLSGYALERLEVLTGISSRISTKVKDYDKKFWTSREYPSLVDICWNLNTSKGKRYFHYPRSLDLPNGWGTRNHSLEHLGVDFEVRQNNNDIFPYGWYAWFPKAPLYSPEVMKNILLKPDQSMIPEVVGPFNSDALAASDAVHHINETTDFPDDFEDDEAWVLRTGRYANSLHGTGRMLREQYGIPYCIQIDLNVSSYTYASQGIAFLFSLSVPSEKYDDAVGILATRGDTHSKVSYDDKYTGKKKPPLPRSDLQASIRELDRLFREFD